MNDKTICLVGASSGIGQALATQLLAQGARLVTVGRQPPEGLASTHFTWDVTQPLDTQLNELPDVLHGLVYAPGTIRLAPFTELTLADYQHDLAVNTLGAIATLHKALPALIRAKGASVVLFSAVAARLGIALHSAVALVKSANEGLTKSLAAEYAPYQVRFNAVSPSLTDTPLARAAGLMDPKRREAADQRHPLGRVGTPDDIASLITYLLSDQASWITGQVIGVDGGYSTLK